MNGKNDCPILLFNEVDAVIQKRTEFIGGGAEKTENQCRISYLKILKSLMVL